MSTQTVDPKFSESVLPILPSLPEEIRARLVKYAGKLPLTVRFPSPGKREWWTSATRSTLYRLWREGKIETVLYHPLGKQGRGQRLVVFSTLVDWLATQVELQPADAPDAPPAVPDRVKNRSKKRAA